MIWKDIIKNEKPTVKVGRGEIRTKLTPEMEEDIEYVVNMMMENPEKIAEFKEKLKEILGDDYDKPYHGKPEFVN